MSSPDAETDQLVRVTLNRAIKPDGETTCDTFYDAQGVLRHPVIAFALDPDAHLVARLEDDQIIISHRPTGRSIGAVDEWADAIKILHAITPLTDWGIVTFPPKDIDLFLRVKAAIDEALSS